MRRIVHKAKNFREAEEWDIDQQVSMTVAERRKVAYELKRRVFGKKWIDIRESKKRR